MPTFKQAQEAWTRLRLRMLPYDKDHEALNDYFSDSHPEYGENYPERMAASMAKLRAGMSVCPEPVRWGMDQLKCSKCERIWDANEEKPPCT